jgi:signal transduction histidine kinase
MSFLPVRNDDGEIIGVAVNASDITERKQHEEEIRVKNEAFQQIALMQSHQLRKPVASLKGLMDLIKNDESIVQSDYYDMITTTVNELDEKILEIVKASESNIR